MKQHTIGLVVNPQAGRDIRRLIAYASVFDNAEKMNIVRKIITTLNELGINRFIIMPEADGIVQTALKSLGADITSELDIEYAPIRVTNTWLDTYEAVNYMKNKVDALIVLGGDGTNRIIAKTGIDVPVMPISTGTNNVFPYMIEATVAAEAVAAIVLGYVSVKESTIKTKVIKLFINDELKDLALIDVAVTNYQYIGTRAIWEPKYLVNILATLSAPYNIGLSAIPGALEEIDQYDDKGILIKICSGNDSNGKVIRVAITPGLLTEIHICYHEEVKLNDKIELERGLLLAFDGERDFMINKDDYVTARITREGPLLIDYKKALKIAAENGFFQKH